MVVVLPAPLGPSRPYTAPALDGEIDAVHGAGVAEMLDEGGGLDGEGHGSKMPRPG